MTDDTWRTQEEPASGPASPEERLAQAEERLAFYTSFDKLIQDNIARSSELMRDALAIREQANADLRRAETQLERVQAEAQRAIADAERAAAEARERAAGERHHFSETLLALQGELAALQDATAAIARRVGALLGDLGAAELVPVAWAAAQPTDEPAGAAWASDEPPATEGWPAEAASFEAAADDLPPVAEAEVAAQAEIDVEAEVSPEAEPEHFDAPRFDAHETPSGVWNPLDRPDDAGLAAGEMVAYSGTGTGELSLEPATEAPVETSQEWESAMPAYPAADLDETAAGEPGETAEAVAESFAGEPAAFEETGFQASGEETGTEGWTDESATGFAAESHGAESAEATSEFAAPAETPWDGGAPTGTDEFAALADELAAATADEAAGGFHGEFAAEAAPPAEAEPWAEAEAAVAAEAEAEPAAAPYEGWPAIDDIAAAVPSPLAENGASDAPFEPAAYDADQHAYREEGFLGGYAAEAGAETEAEATVAVGAEPRAVMVLVHGVPRAAAALSLQRHLAGLDHVEAVEAREYAEGILRLQVTAQRPLGLDDLRSWDGGTDLEPVHVQDDVLEVRLPGAQGF